MLPNYNFFLNFFSCLITDKNTCDQDLAYLVPSLANTQRLTKVHIVNQTIEHLREQRDLCAVAAMDMQALMAENYRLAAEVNLLRSAVQGANGVGAAEVQPVSETMARLLEVSKLGEGTATLRDATEGPEPRAKTTSPPGQRESNMVVAHSPDQACFITVQQQQHTWGTDFSFSLPAEPQSIQQIWPSTPSFAPTNTPPLPNAMQIPPSEPATHQFQCYFPSLEHIPTQADWENMVLTFGIN